jgi:hypothetical protein
MTETFTEYGVVRVCGKSSPFPGQREMLCDTYPDEAMAEREIAHQRSQFPDYDENYLIVQRRVTATPWVPVRKRRKAKPSAS